MRYRRILISLFICISATNASNDRYHLAIFQDREFIFVLPHLIRSKGVSFNFQLLQASEKNTVSTFLHGFVFMTGRRGLANDMCYDVGRELALEEHRVHRDNNDGTPGDHIRVAARLVAKYLKYPPSRRTRKPILDEEWTRLPTTGARVYVYMHTYTHARTRMRNGPVVCARQAATACMHRRCIQATRSRALTRGPNNRHLDDISRVTFSRIHLPAAFYFARERERERENLPRFAATRNLRSWLVFESWSIFLFAIPALPDRR